MRTTIAASPPRLHWQAAFTTKTYKPQTSSLVVWQHVFVSDTPMTNWGGSSLLLTWVVKKNPLAQNVVPQNGISRLEATLNRAHPRGLSLIVRKALRAALRKPSADLANRRPN